MKPKLLASLDDAIQKWIDENCELDYWPQASFVVPTLSEGMTSAAAAVFDVAVDVRSVADQELQEREDD